MICAIVLAAGRSRRMGTQKLLLPFGGPPMVTRVVDAVGRRPVARTFVVLGPDSGAIRAALTDRAVEFVTNPEPDRGMLFSVRCGVRALPDACQAVLIALGDQPGIASELAAQMVKALAETHRGIVVPTCGGRRGHPLLVAIRYRAEILEQHDAVGLRGLLQAHPDDVLELETATPGILEDIDSPEDYRRAVALLDSSEPSPPK